MLVCSNVIGFTMMLAYYIIYTGYMANYKQGVRAVLVKTQLLISGLIFRSMLLILWLWSHLSLNRW